MENPTTNKGWVSIYRKLLDNPVSSKPNYLSVWVHLLLMANHSETSFIWNGKKQVIKEGQVLTGLKKLSEKTGVTQATIYRILKYLEDEKQIKQQKTTKYTLITILNWDRYQKGELQSEKQVKNGNAQTIIHKTQKCLKNEKQNEKQKTTENALTTTLNQGKYQTSEKQNEKQMKNKRKTNEKQMKTYNNVDNVDNENKTIYKYIGKPDSKSKQKIYSLKEEKEKKEQKEGNGYGNGDINTCIEYFQKKLGASLDGSVQENRRYCYNLIRKMKKDYPDIEPTRQIKVLIDLAMQDRFHSKNATSFKYLFYNTQRIAQSFKSDYGVGDKSDIEEIT